MSFSDFDRALINKLRMQECSFEDDLSTALSMAFKYKGYLFFLPRTPAGVLTVEQLEYIEAELDFLELEFLPLDYWMQ